ncbi:MAG: hypothetical protein ACLQUZ_06925 [Rhizomicrobium sp.]
MNKNYKMIHFPKTRLSRLVARSGGVSRVAALENAHKNIEAMHEQGDDAIVRSIAEIGDIVNAPRPGDRFSDADLSAILTCADQIVTLAETFGHKSLNTIAKSLCDIVDGFLRSEIRDLAPVLVHFQALVMVAPGSAAISHAGFQTILGELSKVRKHFSIVSVVDVGADLFGQEAGAG